MTDCLWKTFPFCHYFVQDPELNQIENCIMPTFVISEYIVSLSISYHMTQLVMYIGTIYRICLQLCTVMNMFVNTIRHQYHGNLPVWLQTRGRYVHVNPLAQHNTDVRFFRWLQVLPSRHLPPILTIQMSPYSLFTSCSCWVLSGAL